ncbi:probable E3 ubiquitin-protein ligase HERC4, partial [Oppia nitens]|uniref:probable E3 ubiquitin-protein ligase HERC4 n=1 Tax=Oppia nitens TaxID=1686743 RepID=UPI0023DBBBCF
MELCPISLKDYIRFKYIRYNRQLGQQLDYKEYNMSSVLLYQLLECVRYLHELNPPVIHRDLKPDNILITRKNDKRFIKLVYRQKYNQKSNIYSIGVIIEELFEIDINCLNKKIIPFEYKTQYLNLLEIICQTKQPVSKKRPNCDQIIDQYNQWSISITNIKTHMISNDDWIKMIDKFYVFDDRVGINMLFVTHDDRVYGLGTNAWGSLGLGHKQYVSQPQEIEELRHKKIINFLNGYSFVIFQSSDKCVYCCGLNYCGQLGIGTYINKFLRPMKIQITENNHLICNVSCGSVHTLMLTNNNTVYGWGSNRFGQIGSRDTTCESINEPEIIEFNDKYCIKSVHCFDQSSFALTSDGQVLSWGQNRSNKLGHNENVRFICKPKLIYNLTGITSIQSSSVNTYFTNKNLNEVYFCGKYYNKSNEIAIQNTPKLLGS